MTQHQCRVISRTRREIWGAIERQRILERGIDRRGENFLVTGY